MAGENKNRKPRETAFRRANRRRKRIRKLVRPLAIGGCCIAITAVGIIFVQLNISKAQGTFESPYFTDELQGEPDETEKQIMETEDDFEDMGELEVAAYSADGNAITFSGSSPVEGHTAAGALSLFNMGDIVLIDGRQYVIEDKVDETACEKLRIYYDSPDEAKLYGRRTASVRRRTPEPVKGEGYLGEFEVTAYCSCQLCCGQKGEKLTKTETVPRAGHTIAVDPAVIPLGTRLVIDGVTYLAEDTGKNIKGSRLDIYFDTHEEAVRYGRRQKSVYLAK